MYSARLPGSAGGSPAQEDGTLWRSRGYLPHFDRPGQIQMITFRLADALPQSMHASVTAGAPTGLQAHAQVERLLDNGYGACFLRDARLARAVEGALRFFQRERYGLLAWCIMPNHVHVPAAISYIENNPVKSGLVDRAENWRFSSAAVRGPTAGAGETPALPGDVPLGREHTSWGSDS